MNNIEKESVKYLIFLIIIYIVLGLILYPIFDFIYCKLIMKSDFVYLYQADVIKPIAMAFVLAISSWLVERNTKVK